MWMLKNVLVEQTLFDARSGFLCSETSNVSEASDRKIDVAVLAHPEFSGQLGRVEHIHCEQIAGRNTKRVCRRRTRRVLLPECERCHYHKRKDRQSMGQ